MEGKLYIWRKVIQSINELSTITVLVGCQCLTDLHLQTTGGHMMPSESHYQGHARTTVLPFPRMPGWRAEIPGPEVRNSEMRVANRRIHADPRAHRDVRHVWPTPDNHPRTGPYWSKQFPTEAIDASIRLRPDKGLSLIHI